MFIGPENYALARNISSSGYVKVSQGQEARVGQFPHQLLLTTATGYPICGAALITSIFALTAAHCVIGRTPSKLMIQSGRHRRSSDGSNLQKVPVKNMVVHEHYNYKTHSNDIAMLLLSRELNFDAYTSPIHVPINNTRYEEKAQVSGWGRIAEGGPLSDALLWAEVEHMSIQRCREVYQPRGLVVEDNMLCALGKSGQDACNMDSGGPLTCRGLDSTQYLCGLVSWGVGCGRYPGVYADVAKLSGWIKTKIANYKPQVICPKGLRCCSINIEPQNPTNTISINSVSSSSRDGRMEETNFVDSRCDDQEFYCISSNQCIHKAYLCDGTVECLEIPLEEVGCGHDDGDETQENPCRENEFYCHSSDSCFSTEYHSYDEVCSGNNDGRTEVHGTLKTAEGPGPCNYGYFFCGQSNLCILDAHRCNGYVDCDQEEDEYRCESEYQDGRTGDVTDPEDPTLCDINDWDCIALQPETVGRVDESPCDANSFRCVSSNSCIDIGNRCNGQYDCGERDYSDEEDCPEHNDESHVENIGDTAAGSHSCSPGEFLCGKSEICISDTHRCNDILDCGYGDTTDEDGCEIMSNENGHPEETLCDEDHFYCDVRRQCIHLGYQCGNNGDSWSGGQNIDADFMYNNVDSAVRRNYELDDDGSQQPTPQQVCRDDEFKCDNNECIPGNYECDRGRDCKDGSDEHESCSYFIF